MSDHAPDHAPGHATDAATEHADCGGCALDPDRRAFLRTSAAAVAAALLGLGARRADALAPLAFTRARARRGPARMYGIPAKDGASIDRDNEVILVRWQNAVYAFALSCPHQNTALRWLEADQRFQCPKHKSKYRPDGSFIEGRATRGMDRYSIKRDAMGIAVDLDTLHEEDKDPAGWAAAVVKI
ncbi:Rieske [2Fe-2S] iron-sulfur domain-containing protein [Gemmatirosa kalamazoonensis]|uniref:Rieske [2Fe-2S] iron-sulfur domain-containing protein n=1 Tax=Gemmatirosa kalamazoonensis TaxID=861299 RepID=W0RGJ0_9BACT|nr:Rieske (2Fe-2S) protein [Gemmatirosa kalamazoonensis]AHG89901.1 Rieske [2Fe-2S] iron-sulfur domain-containing protein [Gemmatirosa kalamazoonensis]